MICPHCGMPVFLDSRTNDHESSKAAARKMQPTRKNIMGRVLVAMYEHGRPMTDEQIDAKLRNGGEPESTYRKRRTDLVTIGLAVKYGESENSHSNEVNLWGLTLGGISTAMTLVDNL